MNNGSNDEEKLSKEMLPEVTNEEMDDNHEMENQISPEDAIDPSNRQSNNHRKSPFRCTGGSVGPPPRPFKKARYAWEIKNYEHTVENMSRSGSHISGEFHEEGHESQSSEGNSDISQEEVTNVTPQQERVRHYDLIDLPTQPPILTPPIMPAPYPAPYGGLIGAASPHPPPISASEKDVRPPLIPQDPDAGLFRWHTRQLCRSIFDNTVNRMLENMGFSPVTEQSQGIHPLLVLSLSDEEEREAEEAQHRALETEALTAAMHQKGLLVPPYNYDHLESGTTTDYDSSEEDSELGEEGVVTDDLSPPPDHNHHHLHHHHHAVNRPVVRIPPRVALSPNDMPRVLVPHQTTPTETADDARREMSYEDDSTVGDDLRSSDPRELEDDDEPTSRETSPKPVEDMSNSNDSPKEQDTQEFTSSHPISTPQIETDANENCIGVISNNDVTNKGQEPPEKISLKEEMTHRQNHTEPIKTDNENNNDKFFLDQAIQMAIKQQGLGYQQA